MTTVPPPGLQPLNVVVAIPTFRRPAPLETALREVTAQTRQMNDDPSDVVLCRVLVVDNDETGTGRTTAGEFDVDYVVEPRPGIAAVRNRAIRESADADAIVFIDDDEVPEPHWLRTLISVFRSTGASAVAGRVVTRFPDDVEPWVRASGAFVRPARVDGQAMTEAATNNLIIDLHAVRRLDLAFDEEFGLTGGSDSMFTRELTSRGGEIRWAEHAVVVEQEEAARFTRAWVLMRTFRFGNTSGRVAIALAKSSASRVGVRVSTAGRGALRIVGGGLGWVRGAVSGSLPRRARSLRTVYRGVGMLAAAVGYAHNEYGRRRRPA